MDILMKILYLTVDLLLEFLIVMVVYELVSFFQNKFSKSKKKKFSVKETFNEAWPICMIIALVIIITKHAF